MLGRLARLNRLKVFHDDGGKPPMTYARLLKPGTVSVVDLSDSGFSELNNLVIADILRGVQDEQDGAYAVFEAEKARGRHGRAAAGADRDRGGARVPERGAR